MTHSGLDLAKRLRIPAALTAILASGCGSTEPPLPGRPARLIVVAHPPESDTITARPQQGIVVESRDAAGRPTPGVLIHFVGLPGALLAPPATMLVRAATSPFFQPHDTVTTDALGRASVQVEFGTVTLGAGHVRITADFGLSVQLDFTILPGNLVFAFPFPRDTTLRAGASVQLRFLGRDSYGNQRSDRVSWQIRSTPAGAAVDSMTGIVTGRVPSRDTILMNIGALQDTAYVSVVPPGTYVATLFGDLVLFDLDGTHQKIPWANPGNSQPEPAWSPSGSEIALAPISAPKQIDFLSPSGAASNLSWKVSDPNNPYYPAWSPDGQIVYFTGVTSGDPVGMYRIRRDGTGLGKLLSCFCWRPSISPDGRFMTFHELTSDIFVRVWDIAAGTYVGAGVPGRFPEWAPNSNRIAFFENGTGRLQIMNADGSNRRYLTPPEILHEASDQIAWSADGAWILARLFSGLALIEVSTDLVIPLSGTSEVREPSFKP